VHHKISSLIYHVVQFIKLQYVQRQSLFKKDTHLRTDTLRCKYIDVYTRLYS